MLCSVLLFASCETGIDRADNKPANKEEQEKPDSGDEGKDEPGKIGRAHV